MAVFIELTTDPFEDNRSREVSAQRGGGGSIMGGRRIARRPLRGLEVKDDRPASIKVIQSDGTEIPLVDAGNPFGAGNTSLGDVKETSGYTNFILQNVTEARMEKHQIVETFGESYVFFFGESPRFLDVQMVVINSLDFNWEAEWWENYERYFRGTKLAEMGARLYMFYDDSVVEGFMLNSQAQKTSDQPFIVQMSFRLFVTSHRNVTFVNGVGDPNYPIRASALLPDSINVNDPNSTEDLRKLADLSLLDAQVAGVPDAEGVFAAPGDPFASKTRLTNYLRSVPPGGAQSPSTAIAVEQLGGPDAVSITGRAIRGKISDNSDEYVGLGREGPPYPPGPKEVNDQQEVDDLHQSAIDEMSALGADIDNPQTMTDLGLMPMSGAQNEGAGVGGASAPTFPSFTPSAGSAFGSSLTNQDVSANPEFDQQQQDPLGAVFGGGAGAKITTQATVQGAGDKEYGYSSDFATGPGYGKAGYGDFGGNGFGSGQGEGGDPGYKSPELFSFSGVAENEAAFSRFNKPKRNNTVFGASGATGTGGSIALGAGSSGSAGGASSRIPGRPSSFSIVSAGGAFSFAEVLSP